MKPFWMVILLLGLSAKLVGSELAPDDTGIGFTEAVTVLDAALGKADKVEIYEGLPNPFGEDKLVESEKRVKDCREIAGQWFYARPQEGRVELLPELLRLTEARLFQPWRGMKLCGGFHADYAVAITTGRKTLHVLFCFGCHEAKIVRESEPFTADLKTVDFRITTDLDNKLFAELRTLLAPYRKERPAFTSKPSGR